MTGHKARMSTHISATLPDTGGSSQYSQERECGREEIPGTQIEKEKAKLSLLTINPIEYWVYRKS